MVGGANAVALPVLAQIEGAVLVPHHWMAHLAGLALQLREWAGADVLVLHRVQGYRHAGHPADLRPPDPSRADQEVRANAAPVRDRRPDAAARDLDVRQAGVGAEHDAGRLGLPCHRLGRPDRLAYPVRWDVEGAGDSLRDYGHKLHQLAGADQLGIDPVGQGQPPAALEVRKSLRRPGHLQAADGVEAGCAVGLET